MDQQEYSHSASRSINLSNQLRKKSRITYRSLNMTIFYDPEILLLGQAVQIYINSLVAQMVKSLPAMQEIWVQSLVQKDPLEKEIATHSSILVWEISWTKEPGELQSMGSQRVGQDLVIKQQLKDGNIGL